MKLFLLSTFIGLSHLLIAQSFTQVTPDPFQQLFSVATAFADVNGDNAPDFLITGDSSENLITKLYINDGAGTFTEMSTSIQGVFDGDIAFEDVNGDGSLDVLIAGAIGTTGFPVPSTKLYLNDGDGNFTEVEDASFSALQIGPSVAFADVNADGSPDALIIGGTNANFLSGVCELYLNDGSGNFTEVENTPFTGLVLTDAAFADLNGDGSPDLITSGLKGLFVAHLKVYINDGAGNFSETPTFISTAYGGTLAFEDVNGDGSVDALITGRVSPAANADLITEIHINDGAGGFLVDVFSYEGVSNSSASFADVNDDGNPDMLITGLNSSLEVAATLYINDGTGEFIALEDTPFQGAILGSNHLVDVNNDGWPDVLIAGQYENDNQPTLVMDLFLHTGEVISSLDEPRQKVAFDCLLHPNPATAGSEVNMIFLSESDAPVQLSVFDAFGRLLLQQQERTIAQSTLNTSALPPGAYVVRLEQSGHRIVKKLIVH